MTHPTLSEIRHLKMNSVIADIALDFLPEVETPAQWEIVSRYHHAGFSLLNIAVGGEMTSLDSAMHYLARQRHQIAHRSNQLVLAETVEDILRAKRENKLALSLWFQGATPFAKDIHMIELYYRLGIRQALLFYNARNEFGDGLLEKSDAGLSALGVRTIQEMNRVGMLIDLSHAGIETSLEVIEVSNDPVIFSHSNAKGIHAHIRNLTDAQISALAKKNGVIGMNGMSLLLGDHHNGPHQLVKHIDYIIQRVGSSDHIALGLDLVYFQSMLPVFYEKAGFDYPKDYFSHGMEGIPPEQIDSIIEALLKRHYTEEDIKKILGGNFLRIARTVWK